MEAQPFFNTIAGLAVSLAGFGALIAWLRDDPRAWDPINLWRLKTIVRHALTLAFIALSLVPVFSLSGSVDLTIRWGSIALIAAEILDLFLNRKPDPEIWPERLSWRANVAAGAFMALLQIANLFWASVGVLQIGALMWLASPAGIFSNFVREIGARKQELPTS
ncbi:MAG TPA: hypothetical protein VJ930_10660, partial [Acidimicrobiia bacterium]|nr:hypothetical protein [Acidimicrobiia bacterium]